MRNSKEREMNSGKEDAHHRLYVSDTKNRERTASPTQT